MRLRARYLADPMCCALEDSVLSSNQEAVRALRRISAGD